MRFNYILRIHTPQENYKNITRILGVNPNEEYGWAYKVVEQEEDIPFSFIDAFLDLLNGKEEELEKCDVKMSDIEFWIIYEYEEQCNLEFAPEDLKKLGDKGISLCISCIQQ